MLKGLIRRHAQKRKKILVSNSKLNSIEILQNRFLRASLFYDSRTSVNVLYNEFRVLKLNDMVDMEFVKFVFKFSNNMLPRYFKNYFRSLGTIHDHTTRQKAKKDFFHTYAQTKWDKNMMQHRGLNLWKNVPMEMKNLTFSLFKKSYKINVLKNCSLIEITLYTVFIFIFFYLSLS